jgi:plasmid stability protein
MHMSKMIQLRNVPEALHRKLKARAAMEGMSLSDYLILEARKITERPTLSELKERLQKRAPVQLIEAAAAGVRAERDAH